MKVYEALLIEGSSKFAILCYGIFPIKALDEAVDGLRLLGGAQNSRAHKLLADGWPNGVLLNEILVANEKDILSVVSEALSRMHDAGPCLAAACMYDGTFGGYDDIFALDIASQIYAFCFSKDEPVIVLDAALLASEAWRSIVAHCQQRLR